VYASKTSPWNAGLTLVEVLTAVSLLGIMTAVAATNFTAMRPTFETRGAALLIAGDLNQARMSAVKEGRVYDYLPTSGGYQIRRDDGAGGREVMKTRVLANEYPHVSFGHGTAPSDPYAAAIDSNAPTATITFHSNGTVQNAAGVFLQAEMGDETVVQAVTLSAAGRVRVWKYGTGGWR
jgi:prepilin-type N-terminal cleavage/methylation domain-containing protein